MNRDQDYYRHHTERVVENRNKLMNNLPWIRTTVEDTRFDKHHPFDCGQPGCYMCHPHYGEKRRFTLDKSELDDILKEYDLVI